MSKTTERRHVTRRVCARHIRTRRGGRPSHSSSSRRKRTARTAERKDYKDYQEYVIDLLANRCTGRDGLILYHYMGTGKTFTAVGITENLAMPTVLVAPKGLLPMWKKDYLTKYAAVLPRVKCYSFEAFWEAMEHKDAAWRGKRLLVVDEAHNLARWLSTTLPVDRRTPCLEMLFQFRKRVLLTGTPIYWSEHDLSFLVNIAKGEATIPIDPNAFRRQYYSVKKERAALEGWVQSMAKTTYSLVSGAMSVMTLSAIAGAVADQQSFVPPAAIKRVLSVCEKGVVAGSTPFYKGVRAAARPLLVKWCPHVKDGEKLLKMDYQHATDQKGVASRRAEHYRSETDLKAMARERRQGVMDAKELRNNERHLQSELAKSSGWGWGANKRKAKLAHVIAQQNALHQQSTQAAEMIPTRQLGATAGKYLLGRSAQAQFVAQLPYLILSLVITFVIINVVWYFYSRESDHDFLRLDYERLVREMAPYVSYHAPNLVRTGDTGESPSLRAWLFGGKKPPVTGPTSDSFPSIDTQVKAVSYNSRQYRLFVRFTIGKMTFKDYAQLTILREEHEGATTSFDQSSRENFCHYGRMIGNACSFGGGGSGYLSHLRFDEDAARYVLRDGHRFRSVAPKFKQFATHLRTHPNRRRVVYSNFGQASATLSAYLSEHQVPHRFLRDRVETSGTSDVARSSARHRSSARNHGGKGYAASTDTDTDIETDTTTTNDGDAAYVAALAWFAKTSDAVLILDQSYSEGISIKEADEFHLLDPCDSVAKNEQTKARVVRLGSHQDPRAVVTIYEWVSTLGTLADLFQRFALMEGLSTGYGFDRVYGRFAEWFKHKSYVSFTHYLTDHKQTVTPDAVVRNEVNRLAASTLEVVNRLRTQSVERYDKTGYPSDCGAALGCKVAPLGTSAKLLVGTCAKRREIA